MMADSNAKEIATNGWTSVPLDAAKFFKGKPFNNKPEPLLAKNIIFPSEDPVVAKIDAYAKQYLPVPVYNHSMRAFYFASTIIEQQFPDRANELSPATLALTCLLHDLGAIPENLRETHMSFEFYGAFKSLSVLQESGSAKDQAEAVAEAIIRHQDFGTEGTITFLAQIIQLATIYDNVGQHPNFKDLSGIIHQKTLEDINKKFPRMKWLSCFADMLRMEVRLKPWCHTTHMGPAAERVENNQLMMPYESE